MTNFQYPPQNLYCVKKIYNSGVACFMNTMKTDSLVCIQLSDTGNTSHTCCKMKCEIVNTS